MVARAETSKLIEIRTPIKIERFGEAHFEYFLDHVLRGWHKTEVPEPLKEFRAESSRLNGDQLSLAINTYRRYIFFVYKPKGASSSNRILLNRLKLFELSETHAGFENDDLRYSIGSNGADGGTWHSVVDRKGAKADNKLLVVGLNF